jgi:hypothetical protein
VIVEQQGGFSMRGMVKIAGGAGFPCHTSRFPIVATAERDYVPPAGGDGGGGDNGWFLLLQSDVEPLLACTFRARAPDNSDGFRGVGRIDPQGRMSLAFGNIYECPSGRWMIIAGAVGRRRGT